MTPEHEAIEQSAIMASPFPSVCKYFLEDRCYKGSACPFSHSRPVCKFYPNHCQKGDTCMFQHNLEQAVAPKLDLCRFWQLGTCKKGDSCSYSHLKVLPTRQVTGTLSDTPNVTPCRFYAQGRCSNSRCLYLHDLTPKPELKKDSLSNLATPAVNTLQKTARCRFFDQGKCSNATCAFQHEPSPKSTETSAPGIRKSFDHVLNPTSPQDALVGGHSRVKFGSGLNVELVIVADESINLTVSNLPKDTTQDDISRLANRFGAVERIELSPSSHEGTISSIITFLSAKDASTASKSLDGTDLRGHQISARLRYHTDQSNQCSTHASSVLLSWYKPSSKAWAKYTSATDAQRQSVRFNKKIFLGYQLSTSRLPGKDTIMITGLPEDAPEDDDTYFSQLEEYLGCSRLTLSLAEVRLKECVAHVEKLVKQLDSSSILEVFATDKYTEPKVRAIARFSSSAGAAEVVKALNGKRVEEVRSPLWASIVHSAKLSTLTRAYNSLQGEISQIGVPEGVRMRVYHSPNGVTTILRVYGQDPKKVSILKERLSAQFKGGRFEHAELGSWIELFGSPVGLRELSLITAETRCYIHRDKAKQSLFLIGSQESKEQAYRQISALLKRVKSEDNAIPLQRRDIGVLLAGELQTLEGEIGTDKVAIKWAAGSPLLVILGSTEDTQFAKLFVSNMRKLDAEGRMTTMVSTGDPECCPVCLCDTTAPVSLPCGHKYCLRCATSYLGSVMSDHNFPIVCLGDGGKCKVEWPVELCMSLLETTSQSQMLEASLHAFVNSHPEELAFCPTPDCHAIFRPGPDGGTFRCPLCDGYLCTSCRSEFHEGLTCPEQRDIKSGAYAAYEDWKKEHNVKPCPHCKADIEKSSGCNHMTCVNCKTHICWVCMKTFGKGQDIYGHMTREHGGIGIEFEE